VEVISVRHETAADRLSVRTVNEQAFEGTEEADLVDALRDRGGLTLSLVAVRDAEIVGHIAFSPARIVSPGSEIAAVGLGPMAVLPACQRLGIGSRLVRRGLELLRESGHRVVVVLGHPEYYPRFGFVPGTRFGVNCEFDVPDEVFMVLELRAGALRGQGGTVQYQPEFNVG
jgi:putative acetyltransferase